MVDNRFRKCILQAIKDTPTLTTEITIEYETCVFYLAV